MRIANVIMLLKGLSNNNATAVKAHLQYSVAKLCDAMDTIGFAQDLQTDSLVQSIEERELQLIQQIRTAGIRKPRETALIDEILDLRKDRRRIFASLTASLAAHQSRIADVEKQLRSHYEDLKDVDSKWQRRVEDLQAKMSLSEAAHKHQLEELSGKQTRAMKEEKKRLARKYEEQLQVIEAKLNELQASKSENESVKAKADAAVIAEIESQCNARVEK